MKAEIRQITKEKRNSMPQCEVREKSLKAAENFLNTDAYKNAKCLMLYMPLGNETDTSLILQKALSDGKRVVVPVSDRSNTDIVPCVIDEDTKFTKGAYSISEPDKLNPINESEIDVVLVPGIAFGKDGGRIGFGKGYYDRFLNRTKAVKVGFCYDFQLYETVPSDKHDVAMDYIITNQIIISVK